MPYQHFDLVDLAKEVMQAHGLRTGFSRDAMEQLDTIHHPAATALNAEDLRGLDWCSIDNDNSLDLDQLTYAEKGPDNKITLWVAIADVDAVIFKNSPIDQSAQINTRTVYTPAQIFPMLPVKLSTNLTSLNENEDRMAMVVKVTFDSEGGIVEGTIFRAVVRNHAKLTYNGVGAWLEGKGPIPPKAAANGLENTLRVQNEMAQILKQRRHSMGALTLDPQATEAVLNEQNQIILQPARHNYAEELIENCMIAANHVMSEHFVKANIPGLRRIVRQPKNWDRIVEVAAQYGEKLPPSPSSKALDAFLLKRKKLDPVTFPDLSLVIIKLLGRGEYAVEIPGTIPIGHFGLALSEYTHSSAPNRRFPDLIMQRQYKEYLRDRSSPYPVKELRWFAERCTQQEDAVNKVERQLYKSAAALSLQSEIGKSYKGIITGASEKGTWVRIFDPPVEGKVVRGLNNLKVGDQVKVKLVNVNIPNGFIDFEH